MTSVDARNSQAMSLVLSEDEELLRSTVHDLLAKHAPWQDVLERINAGEPHDRELWKRLATEMGLAGLAIPEDLGGQGASWREVAVAVQEIGRAVAPVPFFTSSVLATAVLLEIEASALLSEMATGEVIAVCAVPFSSPLDAGGPATVSVVGDSLTGAVRNVADGAVADRFLVPTEQGLYLVNASEVTVRAVPSFDSTRPLSDVEFEGASGERIADAVQARAALARAGRIGAAMLATELAGVGQAALYSVVEYLKQRVQFGRIVGSYQALKHQLADAWMWVEQADSAARYAVACIASGDSDEAVAVAVAKGYASDVIVTVTEKALQLHGGIGFTWENSSHLYLKRAIADAVGLGAAGHHLAQLSTLVDLPGPVPQP